MTSPAGLVYGTGVTQPQMTGKARFLWTARAGLVPLALALGCGPAAEPVKDPPLIADPPAGTHGSDADDGAVKTELERGQAYVKNEKFAEAKVHFEKALAIKPSPDAWTMLGLCAEKTSDRAGAEKAYRSALGIDAGFISAAQNLAALLLDDPARPDDAIAVLRPAIAKSGDGQLLQNLAYAYGLKGDVASAGKAYTAALAQGEDAQVRFAWGSLLRDNKQPDQAAEQFKKALAGAKDDPPLLSTLGLMLGDTHAFDECVTAFDSGPQAHGGQRGVAHAPRGLQAPAQGRSGRGARLPGGHQGQPQVRAGALLPGPAEPHPEEPAARDHRAGEGGHAGAGHAAGKGGARQARRAVQEGRQEVAGDDQAPRIASTRSSSSSEA